MRERMAHTTARGLVVRGTDWSETSRIVTLFTHEHGKIRALAKGGRRLKSQFEVALDLLGLVEVSYIRKAQGSLDLLTEARVEERFAHLRQSLPSLYTGYYVAELLADGTQDYDPHPELFIAALEVLRLSEPGLVAVSAFELVWLRELGYTPRLDACAVCGAPADSTTPRVGYSPQAGGVLCTKCWPTAIDRRVLTQLTLQSLVELTTNPQTAHVPRNLREIRSVLAQTVSGILGRRPKLLAYLDGTSRGDAP
jgi:DNA repair protein RecO (recombination protein O)